MIKITIEETLNRLESQMCENEDIIKARGLEDVIDYNFKYIKPWYRNRIMINCRDLDEVNLVFKGYENFGSLRTKTGGYNPFHDEVRIVLMYLKYHYLSKEAGIKLNPYLVNDVVYDYSTHQVNYKKMKEISELIINSSDEDCLVYLKDVSNQGGINSCEIFKDYSREERIMVNKMLEFKRMNDLEFGMAYKEYCKMLMEKENKSKRGRRK